MWWGFGRGGLIENYVFMGTSETKWVAGVLRYFSRHLR
jgi:hypothetical protein